MKKLIYLLLPLFCAINSQALERRVTDGPFIGYVTGGDTQSEEFAWGWQGAYDFYKWLTAEASFSRHEGRVDPRSLTRLGLPVGSAMTLEVNDIALSARYHFYHSDYHSFYLGAGGNFYFINEDSQDVNRAIDRNRGNSVFSDFSADVHRGWGYHANLGVEVSLHTHWEVFAELRYNVLETNVDYSLVRTASDGNLVTTRLGDELSYDHNLIKLGVNYRF